MPTDVLNLRALNRALLARQMLLGPAPLPEGPGRADAVIAMVEHLAGLQAQAPFPPYYGLWSRLAGFQPGDLADLLVDRRVVRIALMRSTIHLVSARDCLTFRPLIQPVLDRSLPAIFGKQFAGLDTAALAGAGRGASGTSNNSLPRSSRNVRSPGRSRSITSASLVSPDQACTSATVAGPNAAR